MLFLFALQFHDRTKVPDSIVGTGPFGALSKVRPELLLSNDLLVFEIY